MTRPYSYDASFITGFADPESSLSLCFLEVTEVGDDTPCLMLRQLAPWPDGGEGERNRATLHRLVDAWLDGVDVE
jgi:hypothetical protein